MATATATRRLEYWGGLGDVVNHIFWLPCYRALSTLEAPERATVVIASHNPHARELFLWHPKRHLIDLEDRGFHTLFREDGWRKENGLPVPHGCDHGRPFLPVRFYPSPDDSIWMKSASARGPYIIFAPTAGEMQRTVPLPIVEDAVRAAVRRGFTAVLVGRNYVHDYRGVDPPPGAVGRKELVPKAPVINLIDKLSVPAVLELIRTAAGVFTCHSVACMAGWHMERPVFVLYDRSTGEAYFTGKFEGYSFGAGRPGNDHMEFSEYSGERLSRWLDGLRSSL